MSSSRHATTSPSCRRRRGIALLLSLLTLTALALIVMQMTSDAKISERRLRSRLQERRYRRALDAVSGIATRMLTETAEDLRIDHLGEEWALPKFFDVGDIRVTISIQDCASRFDLRVLLEEEVEQLEANRLNFINFAEECGVPYQIATRLAQVIIDEAEARRLEDQIEQPAAATSARAASSAGANQQAQAGQQEQEAVPLWLEEMLSLPQLSLDERREIIMASVSHTDLETFAEVPVPFLSQVTIWRDGDANINTASREVLMYSVPNIANRASMADAILTFREEEPFTNTAQIRNLPDLSKDEAQLLSQNMRLKSKRFRVTAVATPIVATRGLRTREARMVLILERTGNNAFTTVWKKVTV